MSTIDIFILIIFAVAAFFGFTKGIVRQIGSVAGVVVGYIAARLLGSSIGVAIFAHADEVENASTISTHMARVLGSIVVFIAVFIGVVIVTRLVRGVVSMAGLGILDRVGGALFSVLKWFLAVSMVLNIWLYISPSSEMAEQSHLLGGSAIDYILKLFPWIMGLVK